jgi:hypothetical protein
MRFGDIGVCVGQDFATDRATDRTTSCRTYRESSGGPVGSLSSLVIIRGLKIPFVAYQSWLPYTGQNIGECDEKTE